MSGQVGELVKNGTGGAYRYTIAQDSQKSKLKQGFTIVELLIVVVVIAILAAITVVSYNGITGQAKETALKSDLRNASTQLQLEMLNTGSFPSDTTSLTKSADTTFGTFNRTANTFCLEATNSGGKVFYVTDSSAPKEGECPLDPAIAMQTVTSASCPSTRTMKVGARDNHTYWIQKMPDGKCWMLTNLAYAGGGTNTYGDTKSITLSTSGTSYTEPRYYAHTNANPTTSPAPPSTSTDGGVTNPQYGYLYNWCAAMGVQTTTSACANALTPAPSPSVSICPANWRLPTGQATTGEFTLLNNAINGGLTNTDAGLRASWLAQLGGGWVGGFNTQGSNGYYWSATQSSASGARYLSFGSSSVNPSNSGGKGYGFSVRCVAS